MKQFRFFLPLLTGLILTVSPLLGQRSFSFSAGVGTAYYYGDLTDQFNNSLIRPSGTLQASWYVHPCISLRMGLSYGMVGSADSLANSESRKIRNLSFRSPIGELAVSGVWHILPDEKFGIRWVRKGLHLSPYVFGGVAVFRFDPQAQLDQEWVRLQPLGTEGQYLDEAETPEPYRLTQMSIPFGGGIEVRFSRYFGLQWEVGYRTTFTDYLDDVSTVYPDPIALYEHGGSALAQLSDRSGGYFDPGTRRGNPGAKDSYFFSNVMITYYLGRK